MIYLRTANTVCPGLIFIGVGDTLGNAVNAMLISILTEIVRNPDLRKQQETMKSATQLILASYPNPPCVFCVDKWHFHYLSKIEPLI